MVKALAVPAWQRALIVLASTVVGVVVVSCLYWAQKVFIPVALAVFLMIVKVVGYLMRRAAPPPPPGTKDCPFCIMPIPIKATKCGHCTSELPTTL